MISFDVRLEGLERALSQMEQVSLLGSRLRPLFEEVLEPAFYARQFDQFLSEGAAGEGGWAPLSPDYAAWKERNYPSRLILQRSGALQEAFTQRGAPDQVRDITDSEMNIGVRSVVAATHQDPVSSPLPRRPVLVWTPDDDAEWSRIVEDYFERRIREVTR